MERPRIDWFSIITLYQGLCKVNKIRNIEKTMKVGGWVQVSLIKKLLETSPILVLIFWGSIPKVANH